MHHAALAKCKGKELGLISFRISRVYRYRQRAWIGQEYGEREREKVCACEHRGRSWCSCRTLRLRKGVFEEDEDDDNEGGSARKGVVVVPFLLFRREDGISTLTGPDLPGVFACLITY